MTQIVEFVFASGTPCETYCHSCEQLRLWAREEKPERCGNCGSDRIEVDRVGSERLTALRFDEACDEWVIEDGDGMLVYDGPPPTGRPLVFKTRRAASERMCEANWHHHPGMKVRPRR